MKRETRVGMVVAGSFIVLVGIVVASKMRGVEEALATEVAQTRTPGGEESETPEKRDPAKDEPKVVVEPKPLSPDLRRVAATEPVTKIEEPPSSWPWPSAPPPLPAPPPLATGSDEEQQRVLEKLELAKDPPAPLSLPALPGLPRNSEAPPPPPPGGEEVAMAKEVEPAPSPVVPPPVAPPAKDDPPPAAPAAKDELPPPAVSPGKDDLTAPPPVFPGAAPVAGSLPAIAPPADPKERAPAEFPGAGQIELPPPPAVLKKEAAPPVNIAAPLPEVKDAKAPAPVAPMGSEFRNPSSPVGIASPAPSAPSSLPKVTTVDMPPYVLKAEDKDFASVSQRHYGAERYADALFAFNRAHPLATADIRETPPRLVAGQMLYIPPKEWLEGSEYSTLILRQDRPVIGAAGPEVGAVQIGAVAPPPVVPPPVAIKAPMGGTPVSLGSPGAGSRGAPPTRTELTRKILVSGSGQHIMQIARQTLGDSGRWPEIYRLNPNIQPQNLIPGGTELALPMDARVP